MKHYFYKNRRFFKTDTPKPSLHLTAIQRLTTLLKYSSLLVLFSGVFNQYVFASLPQPDLIKFKYVKLLPTFVRNAPNEGDICLFSSSAMKPFASATEIMVRIIDEPSDTLNCKVAYLAKDANLSVEEFLALFENTHILTVSDDEAACEQGVDIYLFLKGRRIMFSINKHQIDAKDILLNAQFLALAKQHKCTVSHHE